MHSHPEPSPSAAAAAPAAAAGTAGGGEDEKTDEVPEAAGYDDDGEVGEEDMARIVSQLAGMGFTETHARTAVLVTGGKGVDEAVTWAVDNPM